MRCGPGWSPRWCRTTSCCPAARRIAASIVGNNQNAVRALLASYHRIDTEQTNAGLWIEAMSAKQWMSSATGNDIAANRDAVLRAGTGASPMNEAHEYCGSDEWRQMIREVILPWALGETDLGDDVLEVGPGYGATTDVLSRLCRG